MTKKNLALALSFVAVFVAGGWFFTSLSSHRAAQAESDVSAWADDALAEEAEVMGSLSEAAEAAAEPNLPAEPAVSVREDALSASSEPVRPAGDMPSQLSKIEVAGIAGVVSRASQTPEEEESKTSSVLYIPSEAKVGPAEETSQTAVLPQDSKISMIEVPVSHRLIQTADEYKKFKTLAKGSYPKVDFSKEMLVVLESDSNLPDKVFEIDSAQLKDGSLEVLYRVNVFGLDQKINTHAVKAVKKTAAPVKLKQVL